MRYYAEIKQMAGILTMIMRHYTEKEIPFMRYYAEIEVTYIRHPAVML